VRHHLGAFRTPRTMRLERDLKEMNTLKAESSIIDFKAFGDPPDRYVVTFHGRSLVPEPDEKVGEAKSQQVEIRLGGDYPRSQPQLHWLTPILHPNIWGHGTVCLGNFHNQWTPYVKLVDMVEIMWDMSRLAILNPHSAGTGGSNAGEWWAKLREKIGLPVDKRPLRDKILGQNDGSSILRPNSPKDEIILLDDSEGACQA